LRDAVLPDRHGEFISTPPTGSSGVMRINLLIEEFHRVGRGGYFLTFDRRHGEDDLCSRFKA